ncbi:MAG: helix-turn-helix domain-containing protein [Lachnospiraceae bacterium]|nr:helix-turn-helix domain-containing protein [Lachnospiraceae bacterium]
MYNSVDFEEHIESSKQQLSRNIKHFRKVRKISQQALADSSGLHRTYISDLENAKCNPTLGVMISIADSLNVSLKQLLFRNS